MIAKVEFELMPDVGSSLLLELVRLLRRPV